MLWSVIENSTQNFIFLYIEVCFSYQNSKPPEKKNKINITLVSN